MKTGRQNEDNTSWRGGMGRDSRCANSQKGGMVNSNRPRVSLREDTVQNNGFSFRDGTGRGSKRNGRIFTTGRGTEKVQ